MKIIQVVGRSESGKTTFIRKLIPELKKKGTVAVIKHLGDHTYNLEEEKDTTIFFDTGADISVGIDSHKAVAAIRKPGLEDILTILFNQGITFAIIEGFKQRTFPKIVIGSLTTGNCILSNPSVNEVITSLDLFENFSHENRS
jgi:molybdopterin-guanine dinucleotide biosynthesis protein MobB